MQVKRLEWGLTRVSTGEILALVITKHVNNTKDSNALSVLFQQLQDQANISALQGEVTEAGRELAHHGSSAKSLEVLS